MPIDYKRLQKVGHGLQSLLIDYKKDYKSQTRTAKFTDRLQMTIKVGLRLQSLLIDYKRLQKLDLDYKAWTYTMKLRLGLKAHPKSA